jgi:cytochrome c oxidase cbb3-type subunit 3
MLLTCLCLTACNRESRDAVTTSPAETGPRGVTLSELYAGQPAPTPEDPRAQEYEGNAAHIANGQRYYKWFNCTGCHFNGGGGIGPPLMDDKWIYGGRIEQIYATIVQGRPNGMPSFKDKIPEAQVWEIAAYVRSMSGEADKLAAPSRREGMRSTPPLNNADPPAGPKGETRTAPGAGG